MAEKTFTGLERRRAVIARAGPMQYKRSEIGLPGDGKVTVNRTLDTLRHQETLDSLRGMPLTMRHPNMAEEPRITPDNYRKYTVGSIVGEPYVVGDQIEAEILIGDSEAIGDVNNGVNQISLGYDHVIRPTGDGIYETVGPLHVNHVALVEQGRSGPTVTVQDVLPEEFKEKDISEMDEAKLAEMIGNAVRANQNDSGSGNEPALDTGELTKSILAGLKPLQDSMDQINADKAKAAAKEKADAFEAEIIKRERARAAVVVDAMPFIDEAQRPTLMDKDAKTILVAALGDTIPNAETLSVDYLHGALATKKAMTKQFGDSGGGSSTITQYDGSSSMGGSSSAYDEFVKSLENAHLDGSNS